MKRSVARLAVLVGSALPLAVLGGTAGAALSNAEATATETPAQAPGAIPVMPAFSRVDKNNNGYVEKEEAKAAKDLNFASADKDGDGRLSRREYETARKEQSERSSKRPPRASGR